MYADEVVIMSVGDRKAYEESHVQFRFRPPAPPLVRAFGCFDGRRENIGRGAGRPGFTAPINRRMERQNNIVWST